MWRIDGDKIEPVIEGGIHRPQDLEEFFCTMAGSWRFPGDPCCGVREPGEAHAFFGVDRRGIVTETGRVVEINQGRDFYCAEAAPGNRPSLSRVA